MLQFSAESKRLVSTFLTYRNDIDIYTEDEEKDKEFYKVLLGRLIDKKITINDVTPLGSKSEVIARCISEPENGRKKIFIIDGDITIIHGSNHPTIKNLFILDAYCIENFLLDEDSIIHFIYLNCGVKSKDEIARDLQFDVWMNSYANKLIDLFIHFAIIDFHGGQFTLLNANRFHAREKEELTLSSELIDQEIVKLQTYILTLTSNEDYRLRLDQLKTQWTSCINNLLTIVSGKDYLIPILLLKTQRFKKSKALPTIEEAKFSLAQFCNLHRLTRLKTIIEAL